jgi:hypothetical protein
MCSGSRSTGKVTILHGSRELLTSYSSFWHSQLVFTFSIASLSHSNKRQGHVSWLVDLSKVQLLDWRCCYYSLLLSRYCSRSVL